MELYWAKIYPIKGLFFKFCAELYENEQLDDTMSIAKQIETKRFFTAYSAKKWAEKNIVNKQDYFFIKESDLTRRVWDG